MTLDLEPAVSEAMQTAKENYDAATSRLKIDALIYEGRDFGKSFLKTCQISPDSVMQLAFQVRSCP